MVLVERICPSNKKSNQTAENSNLNLQLQEGEECGRLYYQQGKI